MKSKTRDRFSRCHEFAHILLEKYFSRLHLNNSGLSMNTSADYREHELLCQKIAAEILIPYNIFIAKASERCPSIESIYALCNEFDASFSSIVRRLMELKIWKFGLIHWYIKEDVVQSVVETWRTNGRVSKLLITNIGNSQHLLHTYWTGKPSRERWSLCLIEHKSLTKNDIISFIW